jgi:hypothetical protein
VLAIVGFLIFVVILPLAFGQLWPVLVELPCLGLYVFIYAQDARRRGVYGTEVYQQRLKQRLLGTAFGLLILAGYLILKTR